MVGRNISADCKLAAIRLHESGLLPLETILDCCRFSRRTWFRVIKLWRETGHVVRLGEIYRGRHRILDIDDIQYLLRLVRNNPDYFLDEMLNLLQTNCFISVHFTTIFRELERAGMSRKKLKRIAIERNEERRADFVARMAQYQPEELGFMDEVSKDARTTRRSSGWSKKGKRAEKKQVFVRGRRTSTEALLTLDGIVAGTVVEGSMTKAGFIEYLELIVVSFSCIQIAYMSHNPITDAFVFCLSRTAFCPCHGQCEDTSR
jgi:transposase